MWLNNCIGQRNYRAFIVCICAVAVMTGIVLGTCVYLIKEYFEDEGVLEPRFEEGSLCPGMPTEVVLSILIGISVVNLPLLTLDMQLVILHAFLAHQNLTTYEYIMNKCSDEAEEGEDAPSHIAPGKPAASSEASGGASSSDTPAPAADAAPAGVPVPRRGWRRLKGMKTLPRCMDWIVFVRCGRSRRSPKDKIEHIEIEGNAGNARVVRPVAPEADGVPAGAHDHDRNVENTPTPPGSTVDPSDCDIIAPAAAAGSPWQSGGGGGRAGASSAPSEPSIIGASPREDTGGSLSARSGGKEAEANGPLPGGYPAPGIAARLGCGGLTDSSKTGQSHNAGSLAVASV